MGRRNMPEWYRALQARLAEKFALHARSEPQRALPSVRRPSHNDLRQMLLSQSLKEFSNSSIFFRSWGSWVKTVLKFDGLLDFQCWKVLYGFVPSLRHQRNSSDPRSAQAIMSGRLSPFKSAVIT